jgi:hypothetical protein
MSWQGQLSIMVRHLVNDLDETSYKYSDSRIEKAILVSSFLVTNDADFSNNYSINVEQCSISPDPTDSDTKDDPFVALTAMKTALTIIGSEIRSESSNAISIKDGPSAIDLRGVASTLTVLYKDLSEKYDSMITDYTAGSSLGGQAILGPYAPGSDYILRANNDYDSRGNYFRY